jgi:hypothetical protein
LKELKGTPLSMRQKEVFRQAFPCFMPNVSMFGGKDGNALKRESFKAPPNAGQWPPLLALKRCDVSDDSEVIPILP